MHDIKPMDVLGNIFLSILAERVLGEPVVRTEPSMQEDFSRVVAE